MTTPLNVALIGYGYVGKVFHAPLLSHTPGFHLHTVVSRDAGKVHADLPHMRVVADAQQAFADPAIDLVVIASPNDSHASLALAALDHGKHVVVDKPFTVTVAEAESVIARARDRGRLVSVFQNRRWDADFLTVQQLVRDDVLGDIAELHSHFDRYRPQVQSRWRESAAAGAGLWFDLGPHLLDQAVQLFGMPLALQVDLALQRQDAQAPDYFHAQLRYRRCRVHLHAGSLVAANGLRFAVHGQRGSYQKHGLDGQEQALRAGTQPGEMGWGEDSESGRLELVDGEGHVSVQTLPSQPGDYRRYYQAMHAAMVDGTPPPVSAEQALALMRLIALGERSNAERRELTVA
ncbi:oxidoreductase [Pseudoxanthomonas indica]|uniref:Predicted dehydrogenase n=1 Tax=Pseudoxanthomonas indica TaxID=428993 RepID=A0A1T5JWU3_9GAMM|nr:oxidoreductase [Pseudoxanthomonas indica]GGD44976.1 oxidoreductase [Pseudoxanthomonas indica]SKC55881.1 Predicted dehydrogenase [Pseudoxanthomonas indica]